MKRAFLFLMSAVVQVTYWATMLSAFELNFPEYLCCWSRGGSGQIEYEEKLSVVSLTAPKPAVSLTSIPDKNRLFCKGASDLAGPISNNIELLSPQLQQLLKQTNAQLTVCIELGAGQALALLKTKSEGLSTSDRALISNYLTNNLPVDALVESGSMKAGERYHLQMEVLFTPQPRIFSE